MPDFQNPTEADKASRCSWFEMTQKNCFPKGSSGSSSLTMFGQSWSSRRDSSASSKQGSLGSQEWGQMVDQVKNQMVDQLGTRWRTSWGGTRW